MPMPSSLEKLSRDASTQEVIVSEHLAELRSRVRLLTWISGLCWTALVLFGGLLVSGTLDWLVHFDDSGTRLVIGIALLGGSSWMIWRQLVAPLRQPLSGSFLASRVERRFPGLKNRLVSAVEFLEHRLDARLGSTELQKAVVGQALHDLTRIHASDVVETRAVRNVTIAGSVVCAITLLVVILSPLEAATSVQRLIFPFTNVPWPRAVELQLVKNDLSPFQQKPDQPHLIARGDTLELYVENKRGRLPERVWFEYRIGDDGPVIRETLRQTTIRDEKGQARETALINWIAARGTMLFRATGGDDSVMPFYRVEVVPPPLIESLEVTVEPPAYSQKPVEKLPSGVGHVQGLVGTQVTASVACDKPLKSAVLRIGEQAGIPLTVDADGRHFTAAFKITEAIAGSYWFELTDTQGFMDHEAVRYELRGIADGIPEVTIEDPVGDIMLTADAELPVKILAKDDLGLREVRITYQIGDDEKLASIPLLPTGQKNATESKNESDNATPPSDSAAERPPTGPQQYEADHVWKMADLRPAIGTRIVFRAEATDDYDLGQPHVGKSVPRTITIVSRDDKQKELVARVGNLLENLRQATQLQKRAKQETQELQTQLEKVGELRSQDLDQLRRADLDQRQTTSRLTHPVDGVETQAKQLLEEFKGNRLNDEQTEQRLERLANELDRLEREELPEAERALTRAQKLAEDESAQNSPQKGQTGSPSGSSAAEEKRDQQSRSEVDKKLPGNGAESTKTSKPQDEKSDANSSGSPSATQPDEQQPSESDKSNADSKQSGSKKGNSKNSDSKKGDVKEAGSGTDQPNDAAKPTEGQPADEAKSPTSNSKQTPGAESPTDPSATTPDKNSTTENPSENETPHKAPSPAEKALAEAQTRQTRSLETLQELEDSLSEWRDRRDVSRDLDSVIAEQESLQKESAEIAAQTMTKSDAELTKQDKAELNKLASKQRKLADQLDQFRKQLEQAAGSIQKNDPDAAEKLNEVGQELKNHETSSTLQDAAQNLADNKMGSAAQAQQKAMDELRDLERMMKRQPNEDTEQFLKQTQEAQQEFQQLRQDQQSLAEQAQELAKQPDSAEKSEQMNELMQQQEELTERMAKVERKLERLRLHGAAEATNRARKRLTEMMKQMQDAGDDEEMQQAMEEALDDMEQVEREIALEKRIAQERLAFEQLEKIEDELKALKSRQETVIAETIRLEQVKVDKQSLTRGQLKSLKELAETERSLQHSAEQMQQQMASAEVFSLVLKRLARSLKLSAEQLSERETAEATQTLERDAIRKIDSLLAVLKQEQKKQEKPQQPPEKPEELSDVPQEQEEKPEEAQPPGDRIPQLAQLKLLKAIQEEYLERTEMLNKFRDKDGKLPESMEEEKNELAREQVELADFARNLIAKFMEQQPEPNPTEPERKEAKPEKTEESKPRIKKDQPKETDPSKIDL